MRTSLPFISVIKNQHGVSVVIVAIALVTLLGLAALAIDVGYLYSTRNELQNIADSAALAAARKLGAIYQTKTYEEQQNYKCNPAEIWEVANEVAEKNQAAQKNISIKFEDVVIGKWDEDTLTLTQNLNQPDAVGVTARREKGANDRVNTFFATVFKIIDVGISADAIAALTGKGNSEETELELPIGIDEDWFGDSPLNPYPAGFCGKRIKFSPTVDPEACGGWTSWTFGSNDANLRKILDLEEPLQSPSLGVGDLTNFVGGNLSVQTFNALLNLFKEKGYDVHIDALNEDGSLKNPGDPPLPAQGTIDDPKKGALPTSDPNVFNLEDSDGNPLKYPDEDETERNAHVWITTIVVYKSEDCANPNQSIAIQGYATILLTDVIGPPVYSDKLIQGTILCNYVTPSNTRGGGGKYGTLGPIPGLVE